MREFIALRECLSGAKVTFAGDYYQVRGFRLGVELGDCRRSRRPSGRHRPAGMALHQIPQVCCTQNIQF
jgi:hypothetical protein